MKSIMVIKGYKNDSKRISVRYEIHVPTDYKFCTFNEICI